MHYLGHIELDEAIYHVRIYSLDTNIAGLNSWQMNAHGIALKAEKPVEFDPALLIGADKLKISSENEIRIGVPRFDNMKLTFAADPVFIPLIGALKNPAEIWCEIVREDRATDIPGLPPGAMLFPRKHRCVFWGKCVPQPSKGRVKNQSFASEGGSEMIAGFTGGPKERQERQHIGTFDLTFKHWIFAIGQRVTAHKAVLVGGEWKYWNYALSDLVVEWLDHFRDQQVAQAGLTQIHISDLLYSLLVKLSPTPLFAICDHRWKHDLDPVAIDSVSNGNIHLDIKLIDLTDTNEATNLYEIGWQLCTRTGGGAFQAWTALFFDDDSNYGKDPGQYSLYNFKDLIDALVKICQEFKLVFQCEIPTLEEAAKQTSPLTLSNFGYQRRQNWAGCTRWLFMQQSQIVRDMPKLEFTTKEDTIDYSPCGAWLTKVHVDEPSTFGGTTLYPQYYEFTSAFADGQTLQYRTLSRLVGQDFFLGPDDPRGVELWINSGLNTWVLAKSGLASIVPALGGATPIPDWAYYHAFDYALYWCAPRTILEFEIEGNGVERFGASAPQGGFTANVKRHFGFYDWGEFPLYRTFGIADPGLLQNTDGSEQETRFAVLEIGRDLGGDSSIKAIEMQFIMSAVPPVAPGPPDPPTPPVITPPPQVEPLCGKYLLSFGVTYSGDICGVTVTVNGNAVPATLNQVGNVITSIDVLIDACLLPIGMCVICVTITPCNWPPVTQCWNFTVNHTCCGTTPRFLQGR